MRFKYRHSAALVAELSSSLRVERHLREFVLKRCSSSGKKEEDSTERFGKVLSMVSYSYSELEVQCHNALNKVLITLTAILTPTSEQNMCEFNVILNGKTQFTDVVYAKMANNSVTVKNVLGEEKTFKNCRIREVDVNSTRLVLTATRP